MEQTLQGKRVAILVADGFEEVEMTEPKAALEQAGATTVLISPAEGGKVKAWQHDHWGDEFFVDCPITSISSGDYDALLLPGGVQNPDTLRQNPQAVQLAREFYDSGKPIGAICHGPWLLVEAGVVSDRKLTSYPSLQTDIRNAGGHWVDQEVVVDAGLVTSRKPDDIPAFSRKLIEEIAEGSHADRRAPAPPRELAAV